MGKESIVVIGVRFWAESMKAFSGETHADGENGGAAMNVLKAGGVDNENALLPGANG